MSNITPTTKLTQDRVKELLHYNPDTGLFKRRISRRSFKAGRVAGSRTSDGKYISISIDGRPYPAHRIAWLYMEGYFPETLIDHINRDGLDNRFCNLRMASVQCNARNCKIQTNNTTGVSGVSSCRNSGKYKAGIMDSGKAIHLGYYDTLIEAAEARWRAEVDHDFPNCNTTSSAYQYLKENKVI